MKHISDVYRLLFTHYAKRNEEKIHLGTGTLKEISDTAVLVAYKENLQALNLDT